MKSVSSRLISGSLLRLIVLASNVLVGFFMMPFLVRSLGDESYGLWVLVGAVVGFYGLIDLGMGRAITRFVVRSIHDEKEGAVSETLSTAMVLFASFGAIAFIITIIIVVMGPYFLKLNDNSLLFQIVIAIVGIKASILFPLSVFSGVLLAKYRFDIQSYLSLVSLFVRTILIVWFIKNGYGLIAVAVITSLDSLMLNLSTIFFAKKLVPNIKISLRHFNRVKLKEYFQFGK